MKKLIVVLMVVAASVSAQEWRTQEDRDMMSGVVETVYASVAVQSRGDTGRQEPVLAVLTENYNNPVVFIIPQTYVSTLTENIRVVFGDGAPESWAVVSTGELLALRNSEAFIERLLLHDRAVIEVPTTRSQQFQAAWNLVELREVYE